MNSKVLKYQEFSRNNDINDLRDKQAIRDCGDHFELIQLRVLLLQSQLRDLLAFRLLLPKVRNINIV
jgi:hypothetical protein